MADKLSLEVEIKDKFKKPLKDYDKETKKATKSTKGFSKNLEENSKKADKSSNSLNKTKVAMAGMTLAVGVATKKAWDLVKARNSEIDEVYKLSKAYGISTETLSGFNYVAELNKTSSEAVTNSLRKISTELGALEVGGSGMVNKFEQLGIATRDASGEMKDMETIFFESVDALNKIENQTERSAKATLIFGRNASELGAIIDSGSDAIRDQIAEAKELGVVYSEDVAKQAEQFNDTMLRLSSSMKGITNEIVMALTPALTDLASSLTDVLKNYNKAKDSAKEITIGGITKTKQEFEELADEMYRFDKAGIGFDAMIDSAKRLNISYAELKNLVPQVKKYYSEMEEMEKKATSSKPQAPSVNLANARTPSTKSTSSKASIPKQGKTIDWGAKERFLKLKEIEKYNQELDARRLEEAQKVAEQELEIAQNLADEKQRLIEETARIEEEKRKQNINNAFAMQSQLSSTIMALTNATTQNKLNALDKEKLGDEKYEKEKKKILKKEQNARYSMAVIDAFASSVKTFAQFGYPLGIPFAGLALAGGLATASMIKNQTFASGGIVQGTSTSGDNTQVSVNAGEMILNKQQQSDLFKKINQGFTSNDSQTVINIQGNYGTNERALARMVKNGQDRATRTRQPNRII